MTTQHPSPIDSLATHLRDLEAKAAESCAAWLAEPSVLKANAASWTGLAKAAAVLPKVRLTHSTPALGTTERGLGPSYPKSLLAALRTGWSAAAAQLWTASPGGFMDMAKVLQETTALQAALATAPAPALAPTPRTLVWTRGSARLWRLGDAERSGVPVVVVAPLINRSYVMDLLPGQSLLESLLEGLERPIFLLDWGPGDEDVEGVLDRIAGAIAHLGGTADLFGYCIGGTMAAIHAARHPDTVGRLAIFASPVDFSRGGKLTDWAADADYDALSDAYAEVPAPWVHAPFWALRPTIQLSKLARLLRGWRREGALERFLATELWNTDNVALSGPFFRDWGTRFYQDNALWTGELADLTAITAPTLALGADKDTIIPPESVTALAERTGGQAVRVPGGHVAPLVGRAGLDALTAALVPFLAGGAA